MAEITQDTDPEVSRSQQTPLGIYDRPKAEFVTGIEVIAIGLTAFWLVATALFFLLMPSAPAGADTGDRTLRGLMTVIAIIMPIALIWVAAIAARAAQAMREESQRLQASIDAIRHTTGQDPDFLARRAAVEAAQQEAAQPAPKKKGLFGRFRRS